MKNLSLKYALILMLALSSSFAQEAFFWKTNFESALADRARFFRNFDIERNTPQFGKWQKAEVDIIAKKLAKKTTYDNVWYNYVLGLIEHRKGANNSATLFGNSLSIAKEDPGDLWLLFMEFYQQGLVDWEEKALELLHRQMIIREAEAVPIVAQQLTVLAERENHRRDDLLIWANLFDYRMTKGSIVKMSNALPDQPSLFMRGFKELWGQFSFLWEIQASFYYTLLTWLNYAISLFILAIYIYLAMRYLPIALHPFNSLLPKKIPMNNKLFLGSAILVIVLLGGFIPFVWVLTFLLWKISDVHSKRIMAVVVTLILFSPFEAKLRASLLNPVIGEHALSQYQKVLNEGYSTQLKQNIEQEVFRDNKNFLPHLSLAVAEAKRGYYEVALKNAFAAEYLAPDNAEVQIVLGNIHFYQNDIDKAIEYYRKALDGDENSPYALFNLSQLYQSETRSKGSAEKEQNIRQLNPRIRNALISSDEFFSLVVPTNRVVLYPSFSPNFFWNEMWNRYDGNWKSADEIWGVRFLGLNPFYSLIVFIALAFILFYKHRSKWKRIPLWAKELIENSKIEDDEQRAQLRKIMGVFMLRRLRLHLINMVFPGLGYVYQEEKIKWGSALLLGLTSVFYTLYLVVPNWSFDYPFTLTSKLTLALIVVPVIYNIFFVFYGIVNIYNDRNYREAFDGV